MMSHVSKTLRTLGAYLEGASARDLKSIALMLGSGQSGTKAVLKSGLQEQMRNLDALLRMKNSKKGLTVMGVDLGISNFAFTIFHWDAALKRPVLKDMYKIKLSGNFIELKEGETTMPLQPEVMAELGRNLSRFLMGFGPNAFFIERQRSRTASSSSILENVLKVILLEYVLYSNLQNDIVNNFLPVHVFPSSPKRMVEFSCSSIPIDALLAKATASKKKSKLKATSNLVSKKLRIALCRSLLYDQMATETRKFYKFDLDHDFSQKYESYPGDKSMINFFEIANGVEEDQS